MSVIQKNLINSLISMIGREKIEKSFNEFLLKFITIDKSELRENEKEILFFLKIIENEVVLIKTAINKERQISRVIETYKLSEKINNLFNITENE